jgi:hypothetical protein
VWTKPDDQLARGAVPVRELGRLRDVCAKQGAETVYEQSALAVAC